MQRLLRTVTVLTMGSLCAVAADRGERPRIADFDPDRGVTCTFQCDPLINAAGRVVVVAEVTEVRGQRVEPVEVLVARKDGRWSVLLQTGLPLPGHPNHVLDTIRWIQQADDGGVLVLADLADAGGPGGAGSRGTAIRGARSRGRTASLWLCRNGKTHRVMIANEPITVNGSTVKPQSWDAQLANDGIVTATATLGEPDQNTVGNLLVFNQGTPVFLDKAQLAAGGTHGKQYSRVIAAGDRTLVVRDRAGGKGLSQWDVCSVEGGRLKPRWKCGDPAPDGIPADGGAVPLLGPLHTVALSPDGRIAMSFSVAGPRSVGSRKAIVVSEPAFGALGKVASDSDSAPDGKRFSNLMSEYLAVADDGHVLFADPAAGYSFFLFSPSGTVTKVADGDQLAAGHFAKLYAMGLARQGRVLLAATDDASRVHAHAFDSRGLRTLFDAEGSRLSGRSGRLHRMEVHDTFFPPRRVLAPDGQWAFAFFTKRDLPSPGNDFVGVTNLTR